MRRFLQAVAEWDTAQFVAYFALGALIGYAFVSLAQQTAMLEDVYILAHEQKRLMLASVRRDMAAAAAAKESENRED